MKSTRTSESFWPVYLRLAEDIRQRVASGSLKPGDMVPSEAQLCNQYGISRMTARQGLRQLVEEGLVESFPGRGTFVTFPKFNQLVLDLPDSQYGLSEKTKLRLLGVDVVSADADVARVLKVRIKTKVVRFRKLYLVNDKPIAFDNRVIIYRQGQPVVEKEIHYAAFPEFVAKNTGLPAHHNEVTLSSILLDQQSAQTLETPEGQPALKIEQMVVGTGGQPLGWSVMVCGEQYRLHAISKTFL